jgi:hypothetical protein
MRLRLSSVVEVEVIPGVYYIVDESSWSPPFEARGGACWNRPCRPASDDYLSTKEPAIPRPLDRPIALHYRLVSGWRGWKRW